MIKAASAVKSQMFELILYNSSDSVVYRQKIDPTLYHKLMVSRLTGLSRRPSLISDDEALVKTICP